MDFESKPNNGYEDDEPYSNLTRKTGNGLMKQSLVRYIVMAVIVVVLVFLLILLFHRGEKADQAVAPQTRVENVDLSQLNRHLQQIDKRLALVEKRVADLSANSGKLSAIEGASASNAKGIEALSEKIDKIESHMGKLETEKRTVVEAPRYAKPKSGSHFVKKESKKAAVKTKYHVVRKGETLYHIAKISGISLPRLLVLNHLGKDQRIHPGQKLIIQKPE